MSRGHIDWSRMRVVSSPEELTASVEIQISDGSLEAGDYLPSEREFSEALGLSRTTVRESIHELELRRRVVRTPGRGSVIAAPIDDAGVNPLGSFETEARDLAEMQDLRTAIEPAVASRAAARATPAEILAMRTMLAVDPDALTLEASVELDLAFHRFLAQCTHNPLFLSLVDTATQWTIATRQQSHDTAAARRRSHLGHIEILDAVAEQDASAAAAAMSEHLATVSRIIDANLYQPSTRDGDRS